MGLVGGGAGGRRRRRPRAAEGWPAWVVPSATAGLAVALGVVSTTEAHAALDALASPLAFLLLAVPLAVLLDQVGLFAVLAGMWGGGRHLALALWVLAGAVVVLFNLDAAVVLLTPLYVRIARRYGYDALALAFQPALLASLASSVLPVSNLTNLIVAERFDLTATDFLVHAAPIAIAASVVGWFAYRRVTHIRPGPPGPHEHIERRALLIGAPVVVWLLVGFTVGERLGLPAWAVVLVALVPLVVIRHSLPWRQVPIGAALLALSLGVLAAGAAPHLGVDRVLRVAGVPGQLLAFGAAAVAANLVNNLPALLVALPALAAHQDKIWAVLLGVNIGPTLWVTGALSTLLWQATMRRLGEPVSARQYVATAARVGLPALAVAAGGIALLSLVW